MSLPDLHDSPNLGNLTPEEANRIIRSHRRVRNCTACLPCRQRKVKCDGERPCGNCVKKEHPQLCSYKRNWPRHGTLEHGSLGCEPSHGLKRQHSPDVGDSRSQSLEARNETNIRAHGMYFRRTHVTVSHTDGPKSDTGDMTKYLGQNSIPALMREQYSPSEPLKHVEHIPQDMRSVLGFDNTAPFPLMSPRHLNRMTLDISSEAPSDREVMKLFRTYKEIVQPFWGIVIDIDDLESKLIVYLEERAKNSRSTTKGLKGVSASWLSVLFAVLALGSQYHESPYQLRTQDAQRYLQICFHFLRLGNFLVRPNLDSIQSLLIVSFVLVNDMKAEASWALLGLTCRLAQSLGLHRPQDLDGRQSPDIRKKDMVRRKLWWTCVWHDTLTSLSFDRSPMTNIPCCPIPLSHTADTEGLEYLEVMYHLCQITAQRLNPDAAAGASYAQILANCQALEAVREKAAPHIRNNEMCRSAVDRLQYYAIRLHLSFLMSVCCRPALKRGDSSLEASQKEFLAERCKGNLTETVKMYLAMHRLSVIATRSWAFTYHGLSSALLLGILCETKADPQVRQLQGDLIQAFSATTAQVQPSPRPHSKRSDKDIELSGPLSRALVALKNIYDHGSVVGSGLKREGGSDVGSGTCARVHVNQLVSVPNAGPPISHGVAHRGNVPNGLDPHRSAAVSMAEMQQPQQNGLITQGYPDLQYGDPMQQGGVPQILCDVDTSTCMCPMDLHDSIFWEFPGPFNTGLDLFNLDFLAPPPPGQHPPQQYYF
ncbi:fungal-specific transcription factor domain-containing protein [Coniochaeta sp. 2T2.1]|nr:fungal-specific transcription factor domain-containing protein [Coniochaeta sp. 2T2.1]